MFLMIKMALYESIKKDSNIFFVLSLFILFLVFLYSFSYWHIFSTPQTFIEIYLTSYDKTVSTQDACFSFVLHSSGTDLSSNLVVFLNNSKISDEYLALSKDEKKEITKCILNADLASANRILIEYSGQNVSFDVDKVQNSEVQSVLLKSSSVSGNNNVATNNALYGNHFAFLVFFTSFFIFIYLFSRSLGLLQGILFSITLFAVYSLIRLFLNYFGLYQNQLVLWLFYFGIYILAYFIVSNAANSSKESASNQRQGVLFGKRSVIAAIIFISITIILQLFLTTHFSVWTTFYERHMQSFSANSTVPSYDPLSYLGRPFTYDPGYFLFGSTLANLSTISLDAIFAVNLFFACLMLILAALFFAKSLNFSFTQGILFLSLLLSSNFIFVNYLLLPRPAFALSFLLYGFGLIMSNRQWLWPGLVFGVLLTIQMSMALFSAFLLIFLYFNNLKDIIAKKNILIASTAVAVFLVAYSPILLVYGLPSAAKIKDWGYLATLDFNWFLFEMNFAIWLLLIVFVLGISVFRNSGFFEKKLFLGFILALSIELLIVFRFNIVMLILFAVFAIKLFFEILPKAYPKYFNKKTAVVFTAIIASVFILSLINNWNNIKYTQMSPAEIAPFSFIKTNTPKDSIFIADPYYGHSLAFFGKRKVLSDLYVEYADEEKLDAAYSFFLNKDKTVLEKYNIDFALLYKPRAHLNEGGIHSTFDAITYFDSGYLADFMDKIYSNNLFELYYLQRR